jgi:hypothetical protein
MILSARAFRFEREMLAPLAAAIGVVIGEASAERLSVLREPPIGGVIPDLLIGLWPSTRPITLRPQCTMGEAHIVALLESTESLRRSDLARHLYVSVQTVNRLTGRLIKLGVLVERPKHWLTLAPGFSTRDVELIAIEAKMHRWHDALDQAKAYRAFANRSYVVVDGNQVRSTRPLVNAFLDAGVGLLFQREFALTPIVPAPVHSPATAGRVRAADKLFGRVAAPRVVARPELLSQPSIAAPSLVD